MEQFDPDVAPRRALWETIVEPLRRAIILGDLPSGLHLEEPALAQKFGTSRVPVREALVRLEHEGLVRVEPRRGVFVVGMSPDDVGDLYEFRLLVEAHAIRRAAERIDDAGIGALRDLIGQMERAVERGERAQMAEPDLRFHRQTLLVAGNRHAVTAWDRIAGVVRTILGITDATYRDPEDALEGHRRLVCALERRDPRGAERELRRHLENGERVMREAMAAGAATAS